MKKECIAVMLTTGLVISPTSAVLSDSPIVAKAAETMNDFTKQTTVVPRPTVSGKIGRQFIQHDFGMSIIAQVPIKGLPNSKIVVNDRDYTTNASGFVEVPLFQTEGLHFNMYQQSSNGLKSEKMYYAFIADVGLVDPQLTTDVKAGDTFVKGFGTPGATVTVRKGANSTRAVVATNGEFQVTIPAYSGINDSVMSQTLNGAYSREVPLDKKKMVPLTIFDISVADRDSEGGEMVLMGKAQPSALLKVSINGQPYLPRYDSYAQPSGFFKMQRLPKQPVGTQITIIQVDLYTGLPNESRTVKVTASAKNSIRFDNYTWGSAYLDGTYTGSVVRTRIYSGSAVYPSAGTFSNGIFRYYLGGNPLTSPSGPVYRFLEGFDANGNVVAIYGRYL
ncbi:hypothetical protein HB852_08660 [Listeria grandensis]|uniref:Ig-like domain-containing protein n=1 Tax=Listeria grandensis TaxID=1494963 RepID=UPI0016233F9C|nr:Ig-like domain-containing protein [Listeria grandensis]MBC1474691.1 hypothetical protein [Listeria grandensis]